MLPILSMYTVMKTAFTVKAVRTSSTCMALKTRFMVIAVRTELPFSKAEILFQIRSEDGSALLADKSLTVSRDSKEISGTGDGKIRINYDLAGWALWIFAAAGVVWAATGIRIGLNKKKRKE
jgi:hypothetical protein